MICGTQGSATICSSVILQPSFGQSVWSS
jgi:hypothetical protein